MKTIRDRLNYLIEQKKITAYRISKETGVSQSSLSRIRSETSGQKDLQLDIAKALASYFNVNTDWLLYGEGEMYANTSIDENGKILNDCGTLKVPIVQVQARAGYLSSYGDIEYIERLPTMDVIVDKHYNGNYRIFEVSGDSMCDDTYRSILDGDKVLARSVHRDYWNSKLHTDHWDFWVIVTREEGILIKEIRDQNIDTGDFVAHSLNPLFRDIQLNFRDVVELYNVIKIVERKF